MRSSFQIANIKGISIKIHISFFLLLVFFGKWFLFAVAIFFFVTMHELAHSLVAKAFGIEVKQITLYPIGGVASISKLPEKAYQEFLIAIAGPLSNLAVVVLFYIPMKMFVGPEVLKNALIYIFKGYLIPVNIYYITAQIYWINLVLAAFNLLPAFPMDGGRIFRSLLAIKMGFIKATKIAVNLGQIFAFAFMFFGFTRGRWMLFFIGIFIFISASEELYVAKMRERIRESGIIDIDKNGKPLN